MKYLCALSLLASMAAHADTMRCDQQLVSSGDLLTMAAEKCGPPTEKREYSMPATYRNSAGDLVADPSKAPIQHREWTYNFGSSRLMMRIYAVDQKINKIETLGYGK
ncbi:DUF2845 domain-containing protein [Iodobacter sp. BJB302]|uniref:DUF2845 domain-containing protein n=1 Tax=Iodobacter sp. BJB302 TaxID=1506510 RepID=UPI000C1220B4|nr:DUF2845 domain-containing protein [Iodobacter sp. BJB302]PHV01494.1 hypothetical protein CSQ88_11640 [Iodobacter sp. BJB302]